MFSPGGFARLLVLVTLLAVCAPARAFSTDEESLIRLYAQGVEGLEEAQAVLAPGTLSSTSRTLLPLIRVCETAEVRRGLAWLLERKLLPDASLSYLLREGNDACGPYRHITRTLFRPGVVTAATAYFLFRPESGEYSIGGVLVAGTELEVLVRREDGVYGAMLPDGRVVFVPERAVRVSIAPTATPTRPAAPAIERVVHVEERDAYSYSAVHVGQALVHVVRVDLAQAPMSMAVSPFYSSIAHGPERTLPVDAMAKKAGARVALNGTFFIDKSSHPNYGYPIGSFMIGGRVAWNLNNPQLLRFERSYAAFTDDRRLVLGHTGLSGEQIRAQNQVGQFDPQRIGRSRILTLGHGFGWLIRDKKADAWKAYAGKQFDASYYSRNSHRARSLLGVDQTGKYAYVVAEEEGPTSTVPMSMPDLSEWIAARAKIQDMVFLDGGGSTQLVIEGKNVSAPSAGGGGVYRKNSSAVVFVPRLPVQ